MDLRGHLTAPHTQFRTPAALLLYALVSKSEMKQGTSGSLWIRSSHGVLVGQLEQRGRRTERTENSRSLCRGSQASSCQTLFHTSPEQPPLSIVMQLQTPGSNASLVQPASSKGVNTTITTHLPVTDCQIQAGETEMWQKYLETASRLRTRDRFLCSLQCLHLPAQFNEWLRTSCRLKSFTSSCFCRSVFHLSPIG